MVSCDMAQGDDWTAEENAQLVAAYFRLLQRDLDRLAASLPSKTLNKAQVYRELAADGVVGDKTVKSIEWKMRNVSAVLQELGLPWASGLLPAVNHQDSLWSAVAEQLEQPRSVLPLHPPSTSAALTFVDAPTFSRGNSPLPDYARSVIRKFDPAARDEANRKLGFAGEGLVFEMERRRLAKTMPNRLADIQWLSRDEGDGHGYDIRSFDDQGEERLIEVKTTRGVSTTPFYLSRNEKRVAEENGDAYRLYRIFSFDQNPRVFSIQPPLELTVQLEPSAFVASFR